MKKNLKAVYAFALNLHKVMHRKVVVEDELALNGT